MKNKILFLFLALIFSANFALASIAINEVELNPDGTVKEEEEIENRVKGLSNKTVSLSVRATEKGGLFKSITAKDIVRAIKEQHDATVPESAVHIAEPIKTTGEHIIALRTKDHKIDFGVVVGAAN